MLEKITLDNFTTFIDKTEIDFHATNYKFLEEENVASKRILKGSLFVGENASGKTQILKSILLLLDLLFKENDVSFFEFKSFYSKKKSYSIKYDFLVKETPISYSIVLGENKIYEEVLNISGKNIITRKKNEAIFDYHEPKTYTDLTDQTLFLRRIYFDTHFYDDPIINEWLDFLKKSIYINCYNRRISEYNKQGLLVHKYLKNNDTKIINDFMKKINYQQKITFSTETPVQTGLPFFKSPDNAEFISFNKEGTNVYIPEQFESTGNKTLVEILPSFLYAIENNCMLIVDEFSSGFHNELEECMLKYFFHYAKQSQIFFVSHSTNILNNTILRPDQIYSVAFDATIGSKIKRFSDEMPREAQNTEKMFLNGVFGGMPRYNKIFKD